MIKLSVIAMNLFSIIKKIAEFCREAGEPIFWGESHLGWAAFGPNPTANFVSVKRGKYILPIFRLWYPMVFFSPKF
jgi:hypothetical protein